MPQDKPLKILLVDDEPLARTRLRELLGDIAIQFASGCNSKPCCNAMPGCRSAIWPIRSA